MVPDESASGGEDSASRSTPNNDLASAVVIGLVAVVTMVFSLRLDVPGSVYTAPGVLPFITGLTLLAMTIGLAARAIRAGATVGVARPSSAAKRAWSSTENRRRLLLTAMITAYVLLVAFINFDWRFPTPFFELQVSSFEVLSLIMITWTLRLFWMASTLRCFLVTLITVELLASIFRYGFGILMPETF